MKMRGRIFGTLALTAAAVVAPILGSAASAVPAYGPGACTVTVSVTPPTVAAGGSVTVTLSGTCGNETFTVTLHSTPVTLGTVTTNASGSGSGTFTIPSNTTSGSHTITVSDVSGNSGSASITVTGGTSGGTTSTGLPTTGTDVGLVGGIGAAAVATGGLLVLAARKRRHNRFN